MGASVPATAPGQTQLQGQAEVGGDDLQRPILGMLVVLAGWAIGMWIAFNPTIRLPWSHAERLGTPVSTTTS